MKKMIMCSILVTLVGMLCACGENTKDVCSISGCKNQVYKDGLCPDHYIAVQTADENVKNENELRDESQTNEDNAVTDENNLKIDNIESENGEIGLKNIKYDTSKELTSEELMIAEYFNKDYIFVNDVESLQRYNKIFDNALIKSYVYVEKVLSYEGDDYSLLVKMINNTNELFDPSGLNNERRMIINGTSGDARIIVGDILQINGRYKKIDTKTVDGISITVPIIDIAKAYFVDIQNDPDSWYYVEKPSRFTDKEVKQIAKCIFGEDIMIRKDSINDYELSDPSYYTMEYRDVMGSDVWNYKGPCYVCELDNQSNAKFSKYFFNERMGTMTDAVHENYELSFSGDFKHFYLFMYDEEMESLTVEYYDNEFNKLWKREFEDTTSASYDVTERYIYLCANNEFYIISCETGEDVFEPIYIGSKLDIRKFASGTLAISEGKSDAFMFIDNEGQVKWKVSAVADVRPGYDWDVIQTQEVNGRILIKVQGEYKEIPPSDEMPYGGWGFQYYYYLINIKTGELEYSGDVVTQDFRMYG